VDIRQTLDLLESRAGSKLELKDLRYSKNALSPVLSSRNIENHYDKLARGYVDRYNDNEGDRTFNEAGAYLHNLWFEQFTSPKTTNRPTGAVAAMITKKYGSFGEFKEKFAQAAMSIQGSGWVYLSKNGEIKTIRNHVKRSDIKLLVDWWEHAWYMDYGTDKKKYLNNIWRIIDWNVINSR